MKKLNPYLQRSNEPRQTGSPEQVDGVFPGLALAAQLIPPFCLRSLAPRWSTPKPQTEGGFWPLWKMRGCVFHLFESKREKILYNIWVCRFLGYPFLVGLKGKATVLGGPLKKDTPILPET